MIITNELIIQVGACTQGYIDGIGLVHFPEEYETAIIALENGGRQDLANWMKASKISFIKAIGNYTLGKYRVQDILSGNFTEFTNLTDAQNQVVANGKAYVIASPERFSVNKTIPNEDNTVTWEPVDIATLPNLPDANYQVFNTFTGKYTEYNTTAQAVEAQTELENQVASLVPGVQQQIFSSDGTENGWVNVE